MYKWIVLITLLIIQASCEQKNTNYEFRLLESDRTGLSFRNDLISSDTLNIFNYMYFYNGGGLGVGDLNNDGLDDIFYTANQDENRLFINKGDLRFEDYTEESGITKENTWSTGVSLVDINQDGMLDIYINQVGAFEHAPSHNLLFVCTGIDDSGIPSYEEKSEEYGLNFSGYGTHAAFLDYDLDGDLDMFQLNHSLHANGTFGQRKAFIGTYHESAGDRFYKNEGGRYIDVTKESGINSTVVGYGLGLAVGDINLDGYPDIYVGNDFHENDYLYINNGDGTFSEELNSMIMHTSRFSMGVDIADVNNDLYPDIISLDMLPYDPYILKRSEGEDALDVFRFKLGYGYNHQYARNNLQINNGNGSFSEVGMYSNIHATDWSWAPLFVDFNNDGKKDLFVSNGIPKRMNDMDYIDFMSDQDVQWKIKTKNYEDEDLAFAEQLPEIKLPNRLFSNGGQLEFKDIESSVENNKSTFSNGAGFADFDNDGDLDIVVNNIGDESFLYENLLKGDTSSASYLSLDLKGPQGNINSIGAKVIIFSGDERMLYENNPYRGYQSSINSRLHIGLSDLESIDSILLIWPDGKYQDISSIRGRNEITYNPGLETYDYSRLRMKKDYLDYRDVTNEVSLLFNHDENDFVEFNREPLIPHSTSADGPAVAIGDVNGDGLDDVFLGSSKREKSGLYFQQTDGTFASQESRDILIDSIYEDVDACFVDVNGDNAKDLVVASGGNEYFNQSRYLWPRIYLNDGRGQFSRSIEAFDSICVTASCVLPYDFNGDGHVDLFFGGRAVPWAYGRNPQSFLLQNDGKGHFTQFKPENGESLEYVGFVKNGVWDDIDKDGDKDLLLALEWGVPTVYLNNDGEFERKALSKEIGWWNFIKPFDYNNDGLVDYIVGNLGENTRFNVNADEPLRMYYGDFDANGKKEQILTYYLNGEEIIFPNKKELDKQIPTIKKKYLYAADFAKAKTQEIIETAATENVKILTANYMSNALLVNKGNMDFELVRLPYNFQLTPYKDAHVIDANGDQYPDLLLAGNDYGANIQMGRYDADYGSILINKGDLDFGHSYLDGRLVKDQVRRIRSLNIGDKEHVMLVRNDAPTLVLEIQ